jgi:thiol-disulfide isomerase/thioredoxin
MSALPSAALVLVLPLALGQFAPLAPAAGDIVAAVRDAADTHNFALADREIQSYRATAGLTPELLEALSWLSRSALVARQYDRADSYAAETRKLAQDIVRAGRPVDQEPRLPLALGAGIEVHAQVLAARGQRHEAIAFLTQELAAYRQTSIAPRIQKNINLLSLQGKPAPALDASHWLGPKPVSLATLKGHPVLLFFWAHWCGDCKAEVPILARLMENYGPRGLVLLGPTQYYGFTASGDATPEQETPYIDHVRKQYYAPLGALAVPISAQNFLTYGCSTTPTLVLIDRSGIVRLYHPGAMTYEELADQVKRVFVPRVPKS